MTNIEKVNAKIKELQGAVTEVNGSVMIICAINADKENESCVITGVTGYAAKLSGAITNLITPKDETTVSKIIKKGVALASLYEIMGGRISDATKVENSESNNQ